jgi:hypothetical protein
VARAPGLPMVHRGRGTQWRRPGRYCWITVLGKNDGRLHWLRQQPAMGYGPGSQKETFAAHVEWPSSVWGGVVMSRMGNNSTTQALAESAHLCKASG